MNSLQRDPFLSRFVYRFACSPQVSPQVCLFSAGFSSGLLLSLHVSPHFSHFSAASQFIVISDVFSHSGLQTIKKPSKTNHQIH